MSENLIAYRAAAALALASVVLLVWTIASIGMLAGAGNPVDLLYATVIAVGVGGLMIGRFEAHGLMRTMAAMAVAQATVTLVAIIAGVHETLEGSLPEIVGFNAIYITLFALSACLFWLSGEEAPKASSG